MSPPKLPVVEAAGGVLWRGAGAGREIAVVHRPRYDDWSLPKGKRKPGEDLLVTAVREVSEETGHVMRVGPYLGQFTYPTTSAGRPAVKTVKYWSMEATGGSFELSDEVDELAWLSLADALDRMRAAVDLKVLGVFTELPEATSVLLVVRNGSAVRASRGVSPQKRALDRRGRQQADDLVPVLSMVGVDTLLATPARRCLQTLQPYAASIGGRVVTDPVLAGVLDRRDVSGAAERLLELVGAGHRVALCAEGVVTSRLVATLEARLGAARPAQPDIRKGSWCLFHAGAGELLSVERQAAA